MKSKRLALKVLQEKQVLQKQANLKEENVAWLEKNFDNLQSINKMKEKEIEKKMKRLESQYKMKETETEKKMERLESLIEASLKGNAKLKKENVKLHERLDDLNSRVSVLEKDKELIQVINTLKCSFILFAELYLNGEGHWVEKIERYVNSSNPQVFSIGLSFVDFVGLWNFYTENNPKRNVLAHATTTVVLEEELKKHFGQFTILGKEK